MHIRNVLLLLLAAAGCAAPGNEEIDRLRRGFADPPLEARPRALWDWVDGNFQLEEITREMEAAAGAGMGGFDIWDVRSVVDEDSIMPAGPPFMGEAYLEGIGHAIREAERLGLNLGLIVASGWNAGGPWTLPEHQTMGLFASSDTVSGPGIVRPDLPFPVLPDMAGKPGRETAAIIPRNEDGTPRFYREVAVVAYRLEETPDGVAVSGTAVDISGHMDPSGRLEWSAPSGQWVITRYVCTNTGQPMISSTPNSGGPMIDHFNPDATERHIRFFLEKLEGELGRPVGGSGLAYLYTDSYEVRGRLWTPAMESEFEKRMGYSLVPYLPALEGIRVEDHETTRRFLYDFRRVLSDLIIENHYALAREICEENGIGFVAEAAGPGWPIHNCPFESIKSSGSLTFPRGEFWHLPDNNDFWRQRRRERGLHYLEELQVIKGVASASHLYDQTFVEAEAFTGTHLWNEGPGDLKPTADRAFCEGLNRVNFHTWPHTPEEAGEPGWVYAFGTLVNETRIWWPMAGPWIKYLGRCSYMLQQGIFAGDVLLYYGDSVPNFVPAKHLVPGLGFGYDYDVTNSDILLNRLEVTAGRVVLPHGPSYEILVLPDETYMQPEILQKIGKLVKEGATVVGPKPLRSHGLYRWQERDRQVREMAGEIWGDCNGTTVTRNRYGKGLVIWGEELRTILGERGVGPDFDFVGSADNTALDFIHRKDGNTDIYFVRNRTANPISGNAHFRQSGKQIEFWDPASGRMAGTGKGIGTSSGTEIPLELDGFGSVFVIFHTATPRGSAAAGEGIKSGAGTTDLCLAPLPESAVTGRTVLEGPWDLHFPESSAGAGKVRFDSLVWWRDHPEESVRFFSGIAAYEKEFGWEEVLPGEDEQIWLELDSIVEVARVSLNGTVLGILWKRPYRIDVTGELAEGTNRLRIEVANTWANGLAWDARLPDEQRRTKTNVRRLPNAWSIPMEDIPTENYRLLRGGLAGSVCITVARTFRRNPLIPIRGDPPDPP